MKNSLPKLSRKILIKGTLECKTGLRIGDSKDSIEIGGIDLPVIKDISGRPYIAGSSLKGKMRSLLEYACGKVTFREPAHIIGQLFGALPPDKDGIGTPSRIIVRDAILTDDWRLKLENSAYTDVPYLEVKFENTISREKGTAEHPRQLERIPAGAQFHVEFVINVFTGDGQPTEEDLLNTFEAAIKLLETDYLGGSGSRGYGKVKFDLPKPYQIIEISYDETQKKWKVEHTTPAN